MKKIDVDVYFGRPVYDYNSTDDAEKLVSLLNKNNIEKAFISSTESIVAANNYSSNEKLISNIAAFKDKLFPLLTLDPTKPDWDAALNTFKQAIGIKLLPHQHRYQNLTSDCFESFFKSIIAIKKPVMTVQHLFDERTSTASKNHLPPIDTKEHIKLAKKYPEIKFIFSSVNNFEAANILSAKLDNAFVTTSFLEGDDFMELLQKKDYTSKILNGSHYPFFYFESAKAKINAIRCKDCKKEDIDNINSEKLFFPANSQQDKVE